METSIEVPLNTMLADVDESLRALLKRELERHGFDGIEIVFDAPDREWAAALSGAAVNLFLYDIREAKEVRPIDWEKRERADGRQFELRPPLRVDATYAVTAWTRAVEDEHRLLSQAMAALYAYPILPTEVLTPVLANGSQRYPIATRTARERHEDASDFWTAVGGQYKASFNYAVTLACEAGAVVDRGPPVATTTTRLFDRDARAATLHEMNRAGGTVVDADGRGLSQVWVHLPETGQLAVTDEEGRFRFDRLRAGSYTLLARGPGGESSEGVLTIPGGPTELTLGAGKSRARKR